jgi:hypothetical protein
MRKIHYVDVSTMSEKEICELLKLQYRPWYKDISLWLVVAIVVYAVIQ